MKISGNESLLANQISSIGQTSGVASQPQTNSEGKAAKPAAALELSDQAQAVLAAKQAVDAAPDTRDELIANLKSQIDSGSYHVDASDIADQMMRRAQADNIR